MAAKMIFYSDIRAAMRVFSSERAAWRHCQLLSLVDGAAKRRLRSCEQTQKQHHGPGPGPGRPHPRPPLHRRCRLFRLLAPEQEARLLLLLLRPQQQAQSRLRRRRPSVQSPGRTGCGGRRSRWEDPGLTSSGKIIDAVFDQFIEHWLHWGNFNSSFFFSRNEKNFFKRKIYKHTE